MLGFLAGVRDEGAALFRDVQPFSDIREVCRNGKGRQLDEAGKGENEKFSAPEIVDQVLSPMRKEASACLFEGMVRDEKTLDLLMLLATGIPPAFRGGLLEEMREEDASDREAALTPQEPKKGLAF